MRLFAKPPNGQSYPVKIVIETRQSALTSGGGQATTTWDLPLVVTDGFASNPGGRIAKGMAPVNADRVELRAKGAAVATAFVFVHDALGASFFIVRVPNDAPGLDEAIAYDASGRVVARKTLEPTPKSPSG